MVALNEKFHHNGTHGINSGTTALWRRLQVTGCGLQRNGESGVNFIDQRSRTTGQKRRTSNDLFIDHYSLVIERSVGADEIICCGYPDNIRVSTDIGTGLNDPETELYYARNRRHNSIPGTVLRQEPKSRRATGVATRVLQRDPIDYAGGVNLYEYVGGQAEIDPVGRDAWGLLPPNLSGGNLWAWARWQQIKSQEHSLEMQCDKKCAADAAKLALTLGSLLWDINDALESGGTSVPFEGAGMAYAVGDASQEMQQLLEDGCEPSYRDLMAEADSLVNWARSLMPPPSPTPSPSFNMWPPPT